MREATLCGCMRGKRRSTTRRDKRAYAAPELVDRLFLSASPDRLWLADKTYLPTRQGFLYLSFILDACSRKVVGWSMANHLKAELVTDALEMALWRRNPPSGVIHHSDRGRSIRLSFGERLKEAGIFPSMGGRDPRLTTPWPSRSSPRSRPKWAPVHSTPGSRRGRPSSTT